MSDSFGQARHKVTTREAVIAALFVAFAVVGVWTVAIPALTNDPTNADSAEADSAQPQADSAATSTDKSAEKGASQ